MAGSLREVTKETKAAGKQLTNFDDELKRTNQELARMKTHPGQFKELEKARAELRKLQEEATRPDGIKGLMQGGGLAAGILGFGMGAGISSLISGLTRIVDLATSLVKSLANSGIEIVKISAEAERMRKSFDMSLGKGRADAVMADLSQIAKPSEFDDDQLIKLARPMIDAGFEGQNLLDAMAAAMGVEARRGVGDGAAASAALSAIERIKLSGDVNLRVLRDFGIAEDDYWKEVAIFMKQQTATSEKERQKAASMTGATLRAAIKSAKERAAAGKIEGETLLSVLYASIADKEGGKLGQHLEDAGTTMSAKLNKLAAIPGNIAKAFAQSPGYERLGGVLDRLLEKLDPDGPNGQKIIAGIDKILTKVIGVLDEAISGDVIDGAVEGFGTFLDVLGDVVDAVKAIAQAIKVVADIASAVAGPLGAVVDMGRKLGVGVTDAATGNGTRGIVDQIMAGFSSGAVSYEDMRAQINGLGDEAIQAFKDKLEIRSPSRVFHELGRMTARGFAEGIESGSGESRRAVDALAPADAPSAVTAFAGAGAGGPLVSLTIPIGSEAQRETAEQLAERLTPVLERAIAQILDRLLVGSGG